MTKVLIRYEIGKYKSQAGNLIAKQITNKLCALQGPNGKVGKPGEDGEKGVPVRMRNTNNTGNFCSPCLV